MLQSEFQLQIFIIVIIFVILLIFLALHISLDLREGFWEPRWLILLNNTRFHTIKSADKKAFFLTLKLKISKMLIKNSQSVYVIKSRKKLMKESTWNIKRRLVLNNVVGKQLES
jgi:hypothetical protein